MMSKRYYADNDYNRRVGRVGKPVGTHVISKNGGGRHLAPQHARVFFQPTQHVYYIQPTQHVYYVQPTQHVYHADNRRYYHQDKQSRVACTNRNRHVPKPKPSSSVGQRNQPLDKRSAVACTNRNRHVPKPKASSSVGQRNQPLDINIGKLIPKRSIKAVVDKCGDKLREVRDKLQSLTTTENGCQLGTCDAYPHLREQELEGNWVEVSK